MTSSLLYELAQVFRDEADAIVQPYAWPPRASLTDDERREVERLRVTASRIRYRGDVAAYEEGSS